MKIISNINEILKKGKTWVNYSMQVVNQTKIEHKGHFIIGVNLFNGTSKMPKKILS